MAFSYFSKIEDKVSSGVISLSELADRCKNDTLLLQKKKSVKDRSNKEALRSYYANPLPLITPNMNGGIGFTKTAAEKFVPSGFMFIDIDCNDKTNETLKDRVIGLKKALINNFNFTFIKISASGFGLNCLLHYSFDITQSEYNGLFAFYTKETQDVIEYLGYGDSFFADTAAKSTTRLMNLSYDKDVFYDSTVRPITIKPLVNSNGVIKEKAVTAGTKVLKDKQAKQAPLLRTNMVQFLPYLEKFIVLYSKSIKDGLNEFGDTERMELACRIAPFFDFDICDSDEFEDYFRMLLDNRVNSGKSKHSRSSIREDFKTKIRKYNTPVTLTSFRKYSSDLCGIDLGYIQIKSTVLYCDDYASECIDEVQKLHILNNKLLIVAQPGVGKTHLINELNKRMEYTDYTFLSPSVALCSQFAQTNDVNLLCEFPMLVENSNAHSATFDKSIEIKDKPCKHLIIDEAHNFVAATYYRGKAISRAKSVKADKTTYVTATPLSLHYSGPSVTIKRKVPMIQNMRVISTDSINDTMVELGSELKDTKFLYFDTSIESIDMYKDILGLTGVLDATKKNTELYREIIEKQRIPDSQKRVGTTKLIAEGINLENTDFTTVIINNISRYMTLDDITQMSARFRKVKVNIILIRGIYEGGGFKGVDLNRYYYSLLKKCRLFRENKNKLFGKTGVPLTPATIKKLSDYSRYFVSGVGTKKDFYLDYDRIKKDTFNKFSVDINYNDTKFADYFNELFNIEFSVRKYETKLYLDTGGLKEKSKLIFLENYQSICACQKSMTRRNYWDFAEPKDKELFDVCIVNYPPIKKMCERWIENRGVDGYTVDLAVSAVKTKNFLSKINDCGVSTEAELNALHNSEIGFATELCNKFENEKEYSNSEIMQMVRKLSLSICTVVAVPNSSVKIGKFLLKNFNYKTRHSNKGVLYSDLSIKISI